MAAFLVVGRKDAPMTLRRFLLTVLGIVALGLGVSLCLYGNVGVDPFTSMNIAFSSKLGISLGKFQLIVNAVLLVCVLLLQKKFIGIGTILNMVLVGYFVEWFNILWTNIFTFEMSIYISLLFLIVGVVILTFGASLYFSTQAGTAPYDAVGLILADKTGLPFRVCRIGTDVILVIISFVLSGPLGVATLVIALFTGPLIDFWNKRIARLVNDK